MIMSDYRHLLRLRDDNERAQLAILDRALAGYESNYERHKFGRFLGFFDRGFNRGLRQDTDRHIRESTELTRSALRQASLELTRFPGLTKDQKIELGRYGIGTAWEGNIYLEMSGS